VHRLKATLDWSRYQEDPFFFWTRNRGVRVRSVGGVPIIGTVPVVDDIAVVPEKDLQGWSSDYLARVAAGIFIVHSERVEVVHGRFVGIGASYCLENKRYLSGGYLKLNSNSSTG
jgi:hypothetical protein